MPELPEVEYAAEQLRKHTVGRRVVALTAHHRAQRRTLPPRAVGAVVGSRIVGVERRGKHQLVLLAGGATLLVHFRMNGDWEFGRVAAALPRFARVSIDLEDGVRVSLVDSRALCSVSYHAATSPPDLGLGPEPEDRALTAQALHQRFASKRGPIKLVLLDQTVLAGVGNIYAAEALWRARIAPQASARTLTVAQCARLLTALRAAFALGHRHAARYYGSGGGATNRFQVYDREGEACRRCRTAIKRVTQGQRSTYFCPRCQRDGRQPR